MKTVPKKDLPVGDIRRFLEPGPIVLVSSAYGGEANILTMGWHMVMGFDPSLIGCYIWDQNHSFEMIRKSRECVINIPEYALAKKVVGIGNTSGRDVEKFARFELTAGQSETVKAPLIEECFVNFECKLTDVRLITCNVARCRYVCGARDGPPHFFLNEACRRRVMGRFPVAPATGDNYP
jgi:flavin reductase (DIM6/NTAB) family NADH-FMN oxidoreductase RutF